MRPRFVLPLLLLALATPCSGQGRDPKPPSGGFRIRTLADQKIKLTDGYETQADIFHPAPAPGRFGWPIVVFTHGLGGSRRDAGGEALRLARLGYFVLSYDVRGQGSARTLNPTVGSRLWALDEWIDLAEMIEWAIATFTIVDKERIAVYGDSQGGAHAWAAAAYSDRRLPTNSRRTTPFPEIACVVPRFFSPSPVDIAVRGGNSFHWHLPGLAYTTNSTTVRLDPVYRRDLARFLDRGDQAGLAAYLKRIPGKDFLAELATTSVPILTIQGWQDTWGNAGECLDLLARLPATTPKRAYLTTGQHGTPRNTREGWRQIFLTELWLRRWLKGTDRLLEFGPPIVSAAMPADIADYSAVSSLWPQRADASWPPPDSKPHRFHLRSGQRLLTAAPRFWEAKESIEHAVATGYVPRDYQAVGGRLQDVLPKMPLERLTYDTGVLTFRSELAGTPSVSVVVRPSQTTFMLAARLVAVSPAGKLRVLTSGARVITLATKPATYRVELKLAALDTVIPAKYRVRLELANHHLVDPLDGDSFGHVPLFTSFTLGIEHRPETPSWVELPIRKYVQPDLATASRSISLVAPGRQTLEIRSSTRWANASYTVLGSISGQGPATTLPGGARLYLGFDAMTAVFLGWMNGPILQHFMGRLDGQGRATCTLNLDALKPLPNALLGFSVHLAPVIRDPLRGWATGAPVRLMFQ